MHCFIFAIVIVIITGRSNLFLLCLRQLTVNERPFLCFFIFIMHICNAQVGRSGKHKGGLETNAHDL